MIHFRAFTKRYGGHLAVDALTLRIEPGEVVALLGPNGSGKTTTIKAAAGLVRPTSGTVVLGASALPATDPRARTVCSFLPQRVAFPDALTGREVIEFYRRLRGVPAGRTDVVLKFASLNGAGTQSVGTYSGGMIQRLGLAVAMLPDAPALLLDEPTAALDPDGLATFYTLVDERRRRGATVFFSSHQLGDTERLADRVAFLVAGRLAAVLTTAEVLARLADRGSMRVRLAAADTTTRTRMMVTIPGARWIGDEIVVGGPASSRPAVLDAIRAAGGEITGLRSEEGRLDAFYRELVGGDA